MRSILLWAVLLLASGSPADAGQESNHVSENRDSTDLDDAGAARGGVDGGGRHAVPEKAATEPVRQNPPPREQREILGWRVHVDKTLLEQEADATVRALAGLETMLGQIVRDVPAPAVAKLRKVALYLSPSYGEDGSHAEYHPGAQWLVDNGRDPAMARCVEFSGVADFEAEMRRMPNFALHELAHAYHDRFLPDGYAHAGLLASYEKAKASGKYEKVEQSSGDGRPNRVVRAYAMTNAMEYFAESTEAYFSRNDFFPFTRQQLASHDPEMLTLIEQLWGVRAEE